MSSRSLSRLEAEGFTSADIKYLITCVEEGEDFESFLSLFRVSLKLISSPTSTCSVSKARLALDIYNKLQECRGSPHTTTWPPTSISTSISTHPISNVLSLALSNISLAVTERKYSYQQWGNHAMKTPVARIQFPPHVSSDCTNAVWRSWDNVVTVGKNNKLGKEIKVTVGAKGNKGPRSESKLKYLLKEQKSSIPEDVVSIFTPGFSGPCDTKVPDFFLVEKGHKDSPTTETIGALLYTQSTSDNSKYSADAQVGEAIVAGNLFLERRSEDRQFVYVGITDLRKNRWFKVQRQVATTHQSPETLHVSQYLAGFMFCSLCDLGIMNRQITVRAALVEMGGSG